MHQALASLSMAYSRGASSVYSDIYSFIKRLYLRDSEYWSVLPDVERCLVEASPAYGKHHVQEEAQALQQALGLLAEFGQRNSLRAAVVLRASIDYLATVITTKGDDLERRVEIVRRCLAVQSEEATNQLASWAPRVGGNVTADSYTLDESEFYLPQPISSREDAICTLRLLRKGHMQPRHASEKHDAICIDCIFQEQNIRLPLGLTWQGDYAVSHERVSLAVTLSLLAELEAWLPQADERQARSACERLEENIVWYILCTDVQEG